MIEDKALQLFLRRASHETESEFLRIVSHERESEFRRIVSHERDSEFRRPSHEKGGMLKSSFGLAILFLMLEDVMRWDSGPNRQVKCDGWLSAVIKTPYTWILLGLTWVRMSTCQSEPWDANLKYQSR
jgi:hypothetical protein